MSLAFMIKAYSSHDEYCLLHSTFWKANSRIIDNSSAAFSTGQTGNAEADIPGKRSPSQITSILSPTSSSASPGITCAKQTQHTQLVFSAYWLPTITEHERPKRNKSKYNLVCVRSRYLHRKQRWALFKCNTTIASCWISPITLRCPGKQRAFARIGLLVN